MWRAIQSCARLRVACLERFQQARCAVAMRARACGTLSIMTAQRGLEQLQQRLLRESQHLVVGGAPDAAEDLRGALHGRCGVGRRGSEGARRGGEPVQIQRRCGRAPRPGHRRLEQGERLPHVRT